MMFIILLAIVLDFTYISNGMPTNKTLVLAASSDFGIIVQTACFVDKTLLIKEFMENYYIIMITAPPRFGKSTNMHMIKRFLDIIVDDKGNRVPKNTTENYNIFSVNNLHIFQDRVFFDNYFCNYPTILLDLKYLICISYESFINSFKHVITVEYGRHNYLQHSEKLDDVEKNSFKMFYEASNLTDDKLIRSVATLTELLHTHFDNTSSIVLIDELDRVVQRAIDYSGTDVSKIVDFIFEFISVTLKTNSFVERALVNACVRHSDLQKNDNISLIPFVRDPNFAQFYGLMETELQDLMKRFNVSEKFKGKFKHFGFEETKPNINIYNVTDFLSYLEPRDHKSYWAQKAGAEYFEDFLTYDVVKAETDL